MTTVGYFQVSLSSFTLLSKFSAFAIFFPILSSHFSVTRVPKSASCRGYIKHLSVFLAVDLLLPKLTFSCLHLHHQTTAICPVHTEVSDLQPQSRSTGAEHVLIWQLPPDTDWHRAETESNTWVHWFAQAAFPKGCLVPSASSHMAALGSMFS